MKTITLQEAYDLIESASAVVIDNVVTYPNLDELTGDPYHEWLTIEWDYDYDEYRAVFIENQSVINFDGTNIWLQDGENDMVMITLLVPMKVEV